VAQSRALAQTTASPSPSPSASANLSGDDFDAVCGPILTQAPPTHATELDIYNQKLPICQGAKSAHEAMKDQGLLWKVWTGVSVVCAAACGASFFGMGSEYICIGTNLAAGVTEGVVTENFSSAMSGIMGAGSSFLINSVMSGGKGEEAATTDAAAEGAEKAKPKAESKKDIGACLSALMAAGQAVSKHSSAKSAEATLDAAMQELNSLVSVNNAAALPGSVSISTGETGQSSTVATQTSATGSGDTAAGVDVPSSSCSGSVSTTGEAVVCAAALDGGLPGFIRDPKFQKEFEKGARESFGEFLGREGQGIGQAISGAMDGVLTAPATTRVEAAVEELAAELAARDINVAGTLYGSGGGGRRRAGGGKGGDDDMMSQMAGLMGQLLPGGKKKDGAPDQSVDALARVQKAQQGRSPASLAEDRTLSIFDRVTVRYLILNKSDRVGALQAPGATAPGAPSAGGGMR